MLDAVDWSAGGRGEMGAGRRRHREREEEVEASADQDCEEENAAHSPRLDARAKGKERSRQRD
eukprot:1855694-Rhodomonas_salina.1